MTGEGRRSGVRLVRRSAVALSIVDNGLYRSRSARRGSARVAVSSSKVLFCVRDWASEVMWQGSGHTDVGPFGKRGATSKTIDG